MKDFLRDVLRKTRERIASGKMSRSEADFRAQVNRMPAARSLAAALAKPGRRIIAEVKRASPSRGPIRGDLDAAALASAYQVGGAAAVSVLTEPAWFHGSLDDLRAVRAATRLPVLRKDFLVDTWQAWESRAAGADAALLIVAALPGNALREMAAAVAEAGLEALVEAHDEAERDRAIESGAPLVGVNARNLHTLHVDLDAPLRLATEMPRTVTAIAESGVTGPEDLVRLEAAGYRAFLVGETLVRAGDPAGMLRAWIGSPA